MSNILSVDNDLKYKSKAPHIFVLVLPSLCLLTYQCHIDILTTSTVDICKIYTPTIRKSFPKDGITVTRGQDNGTKVGV